MGIPSSSPFTQHTAPACWSARGGRGGRSPMARRTRRSPSALQTGHRWRSEQRGRRRCGELGDRRRCDELEVHVGGRRQSRLSSAGSQAAVVLQPSFPTAPNLRSPPATATTPHLPSPDYQPPPCRSMPPRLSCACASSPGAPPSFC
jgi:uncharacterized protein YjiS (DUF1127 family)